LDHTLVSCSEFVGNNNGDNNAINSSGLAENNGNQILGNKAGEFDSGSNDAGSSDEDAPVRKFVRPRKEQRGGYGV